MATSHSTAVPESADHFPTDDLPPYIVEILDRATTRVQRLQATSRFETAATHAVQLAALAETGSMSDLDADSLAHAEDLMAGLLPLIGGA